MDRWIDALDAGRKRLCRPILTAEEFRRRPGWWWISSPVLRTSWCDSSLKWQAVGQYIMVLRVAIFSLWRRGGRSLLGGGEVS